MADLATRTALEAANVNASALLSALTAEFALALQDAADITSLDLSGDAVRAVIVDKAIFEYDAADTTTVHDGVTTLVSSDGKRFKTNSAIVLNRSVKSSTTASPPGSPAAGDQYRVPAAPSGGWASFGNHLAIWTGTAWVYRTPGSLGVGYFHYVEDTDTFEYYDASSAWAAFALLEASAVDPRYERYPFGLSIENQTTTSPPGSPATGVAYIVGTSATGAWSGEDGKVAIWLGAAWQFFAPYEGARVYDKALDRPLLYESGIWADGSAGRVKGFQVSLAQTGSGTLNDDTTPENANQTGNNSLLLATITYAAKDTGNKLRFRMSGEFNIPGDSISSLAFLLFKGAAAAPTEYHVFTGTVVIATYRNSPFQAEFIIDVPDLASNQWRFRIAGDIGTGSSGTVNWKRVNFTLEELDIG